MTSNKPLVFVDAVWTGNTELGIVAKNVLTSNPFNGKKVTIWVWGIAGKEIKFTVSAGANSDYSYTGLCVDCYDLESACEYVNNLHATKKLIR